MNIHDDNVKLMADIFRKDAVKVKERECHRCGEYHSKLVPMFNPDDPEARGEYGSCCITEKRRDGWRVT